MRKILIIAAAMLTVAACGQRPKKAVEQSDTLRFVFLTDMHIESDFIERGHPVYEHYAVGNHASLEKTFEFINEDPLCSKASFILLGGDNINTGYEREHQSLVDEMVNYHRLVGMLNLYNDKEGLEAFKFEAPESYTCAENIGPDQAPMEFHSPVLGSKVIPIQGNHDTDVEEFYRNCAFQCGGVRFICFFCHYCALPAPPGQYKSTGRIADDTFAFVKDQIERAAKDPEIRQIVLVNHWGIAPGFKWHIYDACEANGWNDNRQKILDLAEKYNIRLYINGHEHNRDFPVEKVGNMYDINCGAVASGDQGKWSLVEITPDKALFHIYTRANTELAPDGSTVFTSLPALERTIEIPLK
ncbi:MAG: metallophosphoesterase [Bacteroidales bacterium]|nr:metallophosphoesterase [Bacteroidales bacterium]